MARTKNGPVRPTVTDAEYQELLATRLVAMHGYADGTVDTATKNAARAAVRKARTVRKAEEASGVLPAWRDHEAALEAAKAAKPRRPRAKKVTEPEAPVVTDPEVKDETEPVTE